MSGDAAFLPCPVCSHTGVFNSVQMLRDKLIHVSTNKILCPVCQEEVCGLDKLTIHLFSHVKIFTTKERDGSATSKCTANSKTEDIKKPKTAIVKNKTSSTTINPPVKFVKIYPKLPVVSFNTVAIKEVTNNKGCSSGGHTLDLKVETALLQAKNTTCNICNLQFIDANILRMHKSLIHNIDENANQNFTRYHCHLCPKNFKMRGSLMVHLRVAHFGFTSNNGDPENEVGKVSTASTVEHQSDNTTNMERIGIKQWQCDVCRKCFTTKYFLKKHKRLHTGETPYACAQCNKTFTFQQSYHKHLLYHNDEKPHTCTYCGRSFKELSTLHNHQRIHTGEKPFSCETCGKCFRQRVSYLVHRRIHTGVMPYKCTACQKSFRYKVSQRTHKCQAQPPGTVVRQTGDLVEKLKKKNEEPIAQTSGQGTNSTENFNYVDVSEDNLELIRTGAKISLEDMESENFSLLADVTESKDSVSTKLRIGNLEAKSNDDLFNHNIDDLIESIPIADKNVPSPSEILRNLCLSKDDDYIGILNDRPDELSYQSSKDFTLNFE